LDTLAGMPEPAVIALEGELDVHRAHALAPQLSEAAGARNEDLIIDLSDVTLLDSSALGAILQAQHDLKRQGRTVSLVAPNGSVAAVMLDLSGQPSRFSVFASREAVRA
jgi:anti-sigma B factor antagonist